MEEAETEAEEEDAQVVVVVAVADLQTLRQNLMVRKKMANILLQRKVNTEVVKNAEIHLLQIMVLASIEKRKRGSKTKAN